MSRRRRPQMHGRQSRVRHRRARRRRAVAMAAILVGLAGLSSYCATPPSGGGTHGYTHGAAGRDDARRDDNQPGSRQARPPQYRSLQNSPKNNPPNDPKPDRPTAGGSPTASAGRLRPANHDVNWLERHGVVSRAMASDCTSCHQPEDCQSCHTENLSEPFSVHPPNFEVVHAVDARLDQANCTDCHHVESFCTSCHIRTRVSAIEPDDPPARTQFHPPGWLDPARPNNHGVAARRNITECASCHQERDCVTCHASINPHPPEFQLNCGRWLRANPQPCAKCHGNLGAIEQMCR